MRTHWFRRHFSIHLLFLLPAVAGGQSTIHFGSVGGRVTDPSGAVVAGAEAIALHLDTNNTLRTETDREGRFKFPYLQVGTYEFTIRRSGFADARRRLDLSLGAAHELSLTLTMAGTEASVQVEVDPLVLEGARSQIAGTVSRTEARSVPLNGRNFLDLALLIPGVSPTNTGSNQLFAETSAVPGQGLSIGSQRNFSNSFVVDGLSANDDAAGLSGVFYGLDTVEQFQVVTGAGQAELGRALGGYVSVVTRSGTNQVHGELYGYFRNQRWNAANPLSNTKLPLTQSQYGASIGGPVVRDRTFYFANFEQRLLNQSGLTTITPANVAAINARLDAAAFPGARIATGIYSNPIHLANGLGKIDHRLGAKDQVSVRYSVYDSQSSNSRGAGGLNAASASAGLDNRDQTLAAGNVLTLSPRTVIETRGQVTWSRLSAEPSDPAGPAVNIAGVAVFGRLSGSPTGRDNRLYELVNNLSHQWGAHSFRAGGSFLYNDTTITFPRSARGSYSFSSLANFLNGTYNNAGFTQTFGNSVLAQTNPNAGFYVQDEWKVRPTLTVNLGLRYDLQFLDTIRTDRNNWSPRAGIAWRPFGGERTVLRAGFGLYYDRVPLRALANALLSSGNTTQLTPLSQVSLSLSPAQSGAPVFPAILTAAPAAGLPNFTTMDPNLENAYSTQTSVEVEHRLTSGGTLSVGYQRLRGLHLLISINQNVPTCVAAGTNNGCRPNPAYANNSQYRSQADSVYDALQVSYRQRLNRWAQLRVSYSYSKSNNNVGEFFFSSPIDPYNVWRDYGRSDDDQRHRLTANGWVDWKGFQWSGFLQYYSALPLNLTTGATTLQGTTARPVVNGDFIARNAGEGSDFFQLNLRLGRTFRLAERWKLEAFAEGFNALNHRNNLTKNGVFGSGLYPSAPLPTFGQVTGVQDPRSVQLALRIKF